MKARNDLLYQDFLSQLERKKQEDEMELKRKQNQEFEELKDGNYNLLL